MNFTDNQIFQVSRGIDLWPLQTKHLRKNDEQQHNSTIIVRCKMVFNTVANVGMIEKEIKP